MNTQNEPLEVRLQREARNKIWEKLTDSDSLWNTVDDVISHTIAEFRKEAVSAIEREKKLVVSDIREIEREDDDIIEVNTAWLRNERNRVSNEATTIAITAVEGVGKNEL